MKFSQFSVKNCFSNATTKLNYNKELFLLIAPKYNLATRMLSFNRDKAWKNKLIQLLPKIEKPICLDLACGTGDITFKLEKKYPQSIIYGLDLNEAMIYESNKINKFENIKFICNDMSKTPFEENYFDIITAGYALRNAPDLNLTLTETNRILKTDGILAILDFAKFNNKLAQKIQYYLLYFWGYLCGLFLHKNGHVYTYIAQSIMHHPTKAEFDQLLRNNNFEIINKKKFFFGIVEIIICKKN